MPAELMLMRFAERQKLFLSFTPFIFRRQYVSRFSFVFSQLITCSFSLAPALRQASAADHF
jgi:hypothetical protein